MLFEIKHRKFLIKNGFKNPKLADNLGRMYWVCENGNFASAINPCLSIRDVPKILKPRYSKNGYRLICFKKKNYLAHRVIAKEFLGDIEGMIVHHKNSKKTDNRISNLEITSYSKNNSEGFKTRKRKLVSSLEYPDVFKEPVGKE